MKSYALRFISGKYQGSEFPLNTSAELVIGRAGDLDMILAEDMVSRRHAKMTVNGDQVTIQDLDSTNGTFVNGERIKRARLKEGDRLLIGTSIAKLVAVTAPSADQAGGAKLRESAALRRTTQALSMSGAIDEIPLPDLLQLFGSSRKTAILMVRSPTDVGKIYLENGTVIFASINDVESMPPAKCAYRIVNWKHGSFDMLPAQEREFPKKLDLSAETVLMEGMRIYDEIARFGAALPSMDSPLALVLPLEARLRELKPEELDVLQLALNHSMTEALFNNCPLDDLRIAEILVKLVEKGYLRVSERLTEAH